MNGAQIFIIVWWCLALIIASIYHGQSRKDKYNWFVTATKIIIGILILWWGGFWSIN